MMAFFMILLRLPKSAVALCACSSSSFAFPWLRGQMVGCCCQCPTLLRTNTRHRAHALAQWARCVELLEFYRGLFSNAEFFQVVLGVINIIRQRSPYGGIFNTEPRLAVVIFEGVANAHYFILGEHGASSCRFCRGIKSVVADGSFGDFVFHFVFMWLLIFLGYWLVIVNRRRHGAICATRGPRKCKQEPSKRKPKAQAVRILLIIAFSS